MIHQPPGGLPTTKWPINHQVTHQLPDGPPTTRWHTNRPVTHQPPGGPPATMWLTSHHVTHNATTRKPTNHQFSHNRASHYYWGFLNHSCSNFGSWLDFCNSLLAGTSVLNLTTHCLIIRRSFQQLLFLLLEELSNIIYPCSFTATLVQNLARSNQLKMYHTLWYRANCCHCTAWKNTMPPIWAPTISWSDWGYILAHA